MRVVLAGLLVAVGAVGAVGQQAATFAVRAAKVHRVTAAPIDDGVVIVADGKIRTIGTAADLLPLQSDMKLYEAAVLVPGLIDAHATVGLTGILNIPHDQDQLDPSQPIQPELRAIDAYMGREGLVAWLRGHGITTVHTGHGPGALISGQTMVVKTHGRTVERDMLRPLAMIACTLGDSARSGRGQSDSNKPGTRARSVALLREALIEARAYAARRQQDPEVEVELGNEALSKLLDGSVPLLVTAHRAHDLMSALRVAEEFGIQVVLDGAAEAYLLQDEIKRAGCWVLPHPAMARTRGELANATMELPKILAAAGIPFAMQSGFESYVPKTRVLLFEAGVSVGHGLPWDRALQALTIDAARLLAVDDRIGSLEAGKDADLAWFDGDPFEYTTHCLGVAIDGIVFSGEQR